MNSLTHQLPPSNADDKHPPAYFSSILYLHPEQTPATEVASAPDFFRDLNLDQVVETITKGFQEYHLHPFFYAPFTDVDAVIYRQEVMRDLENTAVMQAIERFSERMRLVRLYLGRTKQSYYVYQREPWHLQAACTYCQAVGALRDDLHHHAIASRGLRSLQEYLTLYTHSAPDRHGAQEEFAIAGAYSQPDDYCQ